MEVKPGYKQTEVGVIPEDWEVKAIHEICTIRTGPFGTLLKADEYSDGDGVPLISVGEIREGFLRINHQTPRIPEKVIRRLPQYVLKNGDIVFGRKGSVERSALIRQEQDGWFLGSDGISVRPSKKCHSEYVVLAFQTERVKGWLLQNAIGTTMPSLNQKILKDVVIALPPTFAEQEAIAEALSDADALIESLERFIAKKRQVKQGAMQELLRPKETDEIRLLEEVSSLKGRIGWQGLKQTEFTENENEPFLITGMNFKDGAIRWNEVYHVSEQRYQLAKDIQLRSGDVLMTKDGTIGKVLYIDDIPFPGRASLNSHLLLFRPISNGFHPKYLYFQLGSRRFKDYVELSKSGTTFFGISQASVGKYPVLLPPIEEQTAIAAVLSDMDDEIVVLEEKLAKARQIKQGMMQELLTGRIRLV